VTDTATDIGAHSQLCYHVIENVNTLVQSSSKDIDELFATYCKTLFVLFDKHTPV